MAIPQLDVFQVIADPSRRKILHMLTASPMHINELAEQFDMSRPAVSKHISILDHAGFVKITNMGRNRICTLDMKGFKELQSWLDYYNTFWEDRMQKLGQVLKEEE